MRRNHCFDGCIGGSAGGHHPHCPSAPPEPDHDGGCGEFEGCETEDCECPCHQEEDDGC